MCMSHYSGFKMFWRQQKRDSRDPSHSTALGWRLDLSIHGAHMSLALPAHLPACVLCNVNEKGKILHIMCSLTLTQTWKLSLILVLKRKESNHLLNYPFIKYQHCTRWPRQHDTSLHVAQSWTCHLNPSSLLILNFSTSTWAKGGYLNPNHFNTASKPQPHLSLFCLTSWYYGLMVWEFHYHFVEKSIILMCFTIFFHSH